jgi:hypothetical protein
MAKAGIAAQWLRVNDPKNIKCYGSAHNERRKHKAVAAAVAEKTPIFYHDLDRSAHELWLRNKAKWTNRKSPLFTVARFLEQAATFDGDECLYLPFYADGTGTFAARQICVTVNGDPGASFVARHLCGNGHLNCVNPKHLVWGTAEQNGRDRWLHASRPRYMPEITPEAVDAIIADKRLPNVIAVAFDVPAAIVEYLKRRV